MAARGQGAPKWPTGSGKVPQVFGHFKQLSLNKFFDPSTPSMRKGHNGGEKLLLGWRKERK